MNEHEQITHFGNEVDLLIERYRKEYDISYASVIGVLFVKAHQLSQEICDE